MTDKNKNLSFEVNDAELKKIHKFIEENKEKANNIADDVAKTMNFNDAPSLVDAVKVMSESTSPIIQDRAAHIGGEFAAKLAGQLFDQIIFTNYAKDSLLGWHNKFISKSVPYGARIAFYDNIATGCTVYDITKYIPDTFTNSLLDAFEGSFLKANKSDSDTSYRFKKNKSISPENWQPFFISGKLNEMMSAILADLAKGFSFYITEKYQSLIAALADGSAQTTIENAGENGKNLKLKKFTGTGKNTYESLIEINNIINDLVNDFNKMTLATNSRSLYSPTLEDLIIFIPKKLKSITDSGILARLPNASATNFSRLLEGENVIATTKKIKPMQKINDQSPADTTGNEAAIDIEETPFLPDDTIVVLEKRAIFHFVYTKSGSSQFYGENLVYEHVQHAWGFTVVLPFAKGFVYKNPNLLTYKV